MGETKISTASNPGRALLQHSARPPRRILVADDDPDIRRLNAKVLIYSGYEVDAVEDGGLAWEKLQQKKHDLLLTDNDMPKLSGVELLRRLREANMNLPVILATGVPPAKEFERDPWLKPAATLLKPYSMDALLETVNLVLSSLMPVPARITPARTYRGLFPI